MKRSYKLILFFPLLLLFNACKEENNLINLTPPNGNNDQLVLDSTYTTGTLPAVQPKNVLIEDFTAVHCDNCPNAQKRTDGIIASSPVGRVSVIGIHCTNLAVPGPGFLDFTTDHGDDLVNYISNNHLIGLPTGDVNRKIFPGDTLPITSYGEWGSNTSTELALNSNVNLNIISKTYDPGTRKLTMKITATFQQAYTVPFYISVALIESGMRGKQLTPAGVMDTFTFEHVLRKFMIPYNGLLLANAPAKGSSYNVSFSTVLNSSWIDDNCRIVTFVHQRQPGKNDVEQVQETTIK